MPIFEETYRDNFICPRWVDKWYFLQAKMLDTLLWIKVSENGRVQGYHETTAIECCSASATNRSPLLLLFVDYSAARYHSWMIRGFFFITFYGLLRRYVCPSWMFQKLFVVAFSESRSSKQYLNVLDSTNGI